MNDIQVDGDGFLVNRDDWSEEIMHQLAASDGMRIVLGDEGPSVGPPPTAV